MITKLRSGEKSNREKQSHQELPFDLLAPLRDVRELSLPEEKYEILRHILTRAYRRKMEAESKC